MNEINLDELGHNHDHEHAVADRRGAPDPEALVLHRESALLLVVDVQERLIKAMPPESMATLEKNIGVLIKAAKRLQIPLVVSEQYRKGLGVTIESLRTLLGEENAAVEKMEFSCGASKEVARRIFMSGRKQIIVVGMESHVCVFQTVRDLQLGGYKAFVPMDAVISRAESNRQIGFKLMEKSGATMTSTEATLFDLLGIAGTPEFKELSPLIR